MGYNEGMGRYGFREAADRAHERFRAGDREGAADAIPREMADALAVHGTPAEVRARYELLFASGADVVVAMPPFSATSGEVEALVEALAPI